MGIETTFGIVKPDATAAGHMEIEEMVTEEDDGSAVVSAIDPLKMFSVVGRLPFSCPAPCIRFSTRTPSRI